jgi:hypothetical protein
LLQGTPHFPKARLWLLEEKLFPLQRLRFPLQQLLFPFEPDL